MSGRALLAIGCNAYDHLPSLAGAEADATGIFEALIEPKIGDYDAARSSLLLSPSLQEVREALTAILFGGENLDTLTIAFAGHGAMSSGSFYMAVRDTQLLGLSATALSLASLLSMLAEAAPKQTYLVIDACQSGGLISDLNMILKSEVMGKVGTPGITLLATAASNQEAIEIGGHGIGTSAVLDCIHGTIFLQDSNPALDLVEIGKAVSERVSAAGAQTPVVWGLNLYGPSSFCRNPHAASGNAPLRTLLRGWPEPSTLAAIRAGLPQLWEPYVALPNRWDARNFIDRLAPLLAELGADPGAQIDFSRRIAEAFTAQATRSRDRFREIEIRAACAVALLPFSADPDISAYLLSCSAEICGLVELAIGDVTSAIDGYRFALVTGGLGELHDLPVRLSKLLGWAGFAVHARLAAGQAVAPASQCFADLFARLFDTYSLSFVAMNDSQAPFILTAVTAAARSGLADESERLLGHMFASAIASRGLVAREDIDPSKILDYLIARNDPAMPLERVSVAQPCELILVLLRLSPLLGLAEIFDLSLEELDHLVLNAYLPESYADFGAEHIAGGLNALFKVGHDFWRVDELAQAWPATPLPLHPGEAMVALLASLLFPDRSPWFLLNCTSPVDGRAPATPQ